MNASAAATSTLRARPRESSVHRADSDGKLEATIFSEALARSWSGQRRLRHKRMQAARAKAIWYGHSMLKGLDNVPLLGRGDSREPDAGR